MFGSPALSTLALVLLVACGGSAAVTSAPGRVGVETYLDALRSDDPEEAYGLLDAETRAEVSYDEFARMWKEQAAERAVQAEHLEEGLRGAADLSERAEVTFADGKRVTLHREGGAWRLSSGLVTRTHAGRPHDAVEIFADALARRDVEGVMRILTSRRRQGIARQLDAFVSSLEEHLADASHEIYLIGSDRAELKWRDGSMTYRIVLRAEDGEWRVDDVHLSPDADGADEEEAAEGKEESSP